MEQVSRRNFIRNGLITGQAAAVLLSSQAVMAAKAKVAQTSKSGKAFKLGIVGCGNRCREHIRVLNGVPEIEIAALCDIFPPKMDMRAKEIKQGPAPQKYTELETMLKQQDLDAVAVILPNHLHKMATIAALQAGKHVFCEKPMALTVSDCNEMIKVSQQTGKAIQIGTQRRHSVGYKKAVEAIRAASLGAILSSDINSYRGDWRVPAADEQPEGTKYWRLNQELSGGVVYEMGAHIIDVNNWIMDSEPVTVVSLQGVTDPALRKRDSADCGSVLVSYANGAITNYGGNLYNYAGSPDNYFFAVNGTVRVDDMKELEITYGHASGIKSDEPLPKPVSMDISGNDGTSEQWTYFAKVLAGEAKPFPNSFMARQSIQICQGSVISWKEGKVVNVKDLDSI